MPLKFSNLFSINKMEYFHGKKPKVDCILCEIARDSNKVNNLTVYKGKNAMISVNKYPYNSGHLLIFPLRHITDIRALNEEEEQEISELLKKSLDILDELYSPSGFNFGYNMGDFSGASISHIHMHVIPRFKNELGFIDIIGGAKIIVEDPLITMKRLREAFKNI